MIKKIFGFLFSPLLLTLLALVIVALLIWWIGPHGEDRRAGAARKRTRPCTADRRHRAHRGAARTLPPLARAPCEPAPDRRPHEGAVREDGRAGQRRTEDPRYALQRSRGHAQADAPACGRQEARLARLALHLRRQLSVRPAVVRVHRRARRGQDHRAGQLRPLVSAGREVRPRRHSRRGRHAQLRLVVHRRGRAHRHRRPLHHARQPPVGRQERMGRLFGPAQEGAPAPAAQRRVPHGERGRPAEPGPRAAHAAGRFHSRAAARAGCEAHHAAAGVRARHQERLALRLYRLLRRPWQRAARAGVRLYAAGRRECASRREGPFHRLQPRVRAAAQPRQRRTHCAHAARDRWHAARGDLWLSGAVRLHRLDAVRPARPGVHRLALCAAAVGARRLLHQRHARGQPDRPRDGQPCAQLRPGARHARAAEVERPQLLSHRAAARGGVSRAAPGRRQREAGAPAPRAAHGRRVRP